MPQGRSLGAGRCLPNIWEKGGREAIEMAQETSAPGAPPKLLLSEPHVQASAWGDKAEDRSGECGPVCVTELVTITSFASKWTF